MTASEGKPSTGGEPSVEGMLSAEGEPSAVGKPSAGSGGVRSHSVSAGRVGRPHGLDGSFYVTGARPRLLVLGAEVTVAGRIATVVRRAGTEAHPIVRLEGVENRTGAEALRGEELTIDSASMPALEEGEWWASELEGCEVVDGQRHVGTVMRLVELPSCEALEVMLARPDGHGVEGTGSGLEGSGSGVEGTSSGEGGTGGSVEGPAGKRGRELLVPMVRDAIRHVDTAQRRIDVDMSFIEDA